jgi:hypothetical protein
VARNRDINIRLLSSGTDKTRRDLESIGVSANKMDGALTKASGGFSRLAAGAQPLANIHPALAQVVSLVQSLGQHLGDVQGQSDAATGSLSSGAASVATVASAANVNMQRLAAGANVATGSFVALAAVGIRSFVDLGGEIRQIQRVSGLGAEDASKLAFAFHAVGIDAETGAAGIFRFGKNLETGLAAITKFGVEIAHTKSGAVDIQGTLLNLSDTYNALGDQTQKNALVQAAFGRGGLALVPILAKGRQGIKELYDEARKSGLILDQRQVDQTKDFAQAMRELQSAGKGLAISVGGGVTPAITELTSAITPLLQFLTRTHILSTALVALLAGQVARAFVSTAASAITWATSLSTLDVSLIGTTAEMRGLAVAEGEVVAANAGMGASFAAAAGPIGLAVAALFALHASTKGLRDDLPGDVKKAVTATNAELDKLVRGIEHPGLVKGFLQHRDPTGDAADHFATIKKLVEQTADSSESSAQRIIDAFKRTGGSAADVKKLEDALAKVHGKHKQGADAAKADAAANEEFGLAATDAASSVTNASSAMDLYNNSLTSLNRNLDVAAADRGLVAEQTKLNDLRKNDGTAEHTKRVNDLTRADIDNQRAVRSLADAQRTLGDVRKEDVAALQAQARLEVEHAVSGQEHAARTLADALEHQRRVEAAGGSPKAKADATLAVKDATLGVADAAKQRADAEQKVVDIPLDHQRRLQDAVLGVRDAQLQARDASDKLRDAYLAAQVPASALATTTAEIADQLDRIIKAAEADVGAKIAAGLLPATDGSAALLDVLQQLPPAMQALPQVAGLMNAIASEAAQAVIALYGHGYAVPTGRASGGAVYGGRDYLVGERGPEVLRMSGPGYVFPSHHAVARRALGGPVGSWSGTRVYGGDGAAMGHTTVEQFTGDVIANGLTLEEVRREQRRDGRRRSASKASRGG